MIKALNKVGIEEKYHHIMMAIYDKPSANIILSDEKLSISSNIKDKTRMSTLATVFQHSTGSPLQSNQAKERNKIGIQIGNEEVK